MSNICIRPLLVFVSTCSEDFGATRQDRRHLVYDKHKTSH